MINRKILYFLPVLFTVLFPFFARADNFCYEWKNNLYYGLQNNLEVKFLQTALSKENLFGETMATGNFFGLTKQAVKNFQKKYNISQTGFVGSLTRGKLNEIYKCGNNSASGSASRPIISEVSPAFGPTGTKITIRGSGFTTKDNTIYVGYDVLTGTESPNGKTIVFTMSPPMPSDIKLPFPLPFGFYVENKNGLSNEGLYKLTFEKSLTEKISAGFKHFADYFRLSKSQAAAEVLFIPFGGELINVDYCCNGLRLSVSPPRPGTYMFTAGSVLYAYYQILRTGVWVLGDALPAGVCQTGTYCATSIPTTGTIRQIGTSLK